MEEKKKFDNIVKERKKNKKKSAAAAVLMTAFIAVVGIYYCFAELFVYKDIKIESVNGDECPYTESELEKYLQLEKGQGLYSIDEDVLQERIKYNLPYIKSAEVSRQIPNSIKMKMAYEKPTYYTEVGGDLFILGDDLKVLEKTKDIEKIEINSLILLQLSDVRKCIEGEMLGIDDDTVKTLLQIEEGLQKNDAFSDVLIIDLKNKFDINLLCTSRFSVKLGDKSNLETKILLMKTVIGDKSASNEGGIIDVSDDAAREAIFRRYG